MSDREARIEKANEIKAKLEALPFPRVKIEVYGSQIVVTCKGDKTARTWAKTLRLFATIKGVLDTREYNKVNTGGCLNPSSYKVKRIFATL